MTAWDGSSNGAGTEMVGTNGTDAHDLKGHSVYLDLNQCCSTYCIAGG